VLESWLYRNFGYEMIDSIKTFFETIIRLRSKEIYLIDHDESTKLNESIACRD